MLRSYCGPVQRLRCLSSRSNREVFLVEDLSGRWRILKVVRGLSEAQLKRFLEAYRAIQEADGCEHLMPVVAFGVESGEAWVEMPVADSVEEQGKNFDTYSPLQLHSGATPDGQVRVAWVAGIGLQVVKALIQLESAGLLHGDVKPSNLLRLNGRWVLGDLDTVGPPRAQDAVSASTEGYAPPGGDQGFGRDPYALGKLLYELWTENSRLEYPAMPRRTLTQGKWTWRERLLNRTIHGLCDPVGTARLQMLAAIQQILEALASGHDSSLAAAEGLLQRGRPRRLWRVAAIALSVLVLAYAWWAIRYRIPAGSFRGDLTRTPIVWTPYHHPKRINEGFVQQGADGKSYGWLLFNAHGGVPVPLNTGDEVFVTLKKDVWRGHVAMYVSEKPIYRADPQRSFGHGGNFGNLSHLMWFHLEGDWLTNPTVAKAGKLVSFSLGEWNQRVATNSLATYHLKFQVGADRYSWQVASGGVQLATGSYPRIYQPGYLGIYAFDDTLCYLTRLEIKPGDVRASPR